MVKTLAKAMEHNTKAFLNALSKNQDKEEGGTWSLAGVEASQAGHGLRGPTVTDFDSYLTRVERREAWITELRDEAKVRAIQISTLDSKSDLPTKVHSHEEFCIIMRDNFAQAPMGAISKKKQST